ncbi:MAG: glycosyltransferase [Clostridiaceae bacterium]|nr:glycosyltransferase [Clostridiaceae bacterium]
MEKISVIIPCYNVENYIEKCLDSVLGQTIGRECLEIILVDDCSVDGTLSILKSYEQTYSESILLVLSEKNGRQGAARNIGLSYASGDYVCFVDADDYLAADALKIAYRLITETESDLVQFCYTGEKEKLAERSGTETDYQVYDFAEGENRRKYCMNSGILNESCTTKFYRRELLVRSGVRYAEGLSYEEPLFTYPLKFFVNRVCVTEACLYFYRYNEAGTTAAHMSRLSTITEHLQVQLQLFDFMKGQPFFRAYQAEITLYFVHSYYVSVFYFLKYRGACVPVSLFRSLCSAVRRLVPDYAQNPYWKVPALQEEKKLVDLIAAEPGLSDGRLGELAKEIYQTIS